MKNLIPKMSTKDKILLPIGLVVAIGGLVFWYFFPEYRSAEVTLPFISIMSAGVGFIIGIFLGHSAAQMDVEKKIKKMFNERDL